MKREIFGIPKSEAELREDLSWFLATVAECGDLEAMFGFAWGNYRYSGEWQWESLAPSAILSELAAYESVGDGRLGGDDLHLRVPSLGCERLYCHHADVHFTVDESSELFRLQQQRWRERGWDVREAAPAAPQST